MAFCIIFNHYIKLLETHEDEQQCLDSNDYHYPIITAGDIRNSLVEDGWDEKKVTSAKIGRRLKTLGFESESQRDGRKVKRVLKIDADKLKRLQRRYVTAVTDVTAVTEQVKIKENGVET